MMRFCRHIPAPPLGEFIHHLWLYEDYAPATHANERILPTGTIEMVINLREHQLRIYDPEVRRCRRFPGAVVSGPYGRCFVTDTAEEKSVIGVHFKPAGAFPFLGVPPEELADVHVDLESLWGRDARELCDGLREARAPQKRFSILESALLRHRKKPLEHHWAVAATVERLTTSGAPPLIRELAKGLGLSQRRLIRVFAGEAGLTPKLFGRIQRFQRAIVMASDGRDSSDWSDIALRCGYFDQAHLIDDFVEFSEFTPTEYLRQLTRLRLQGLRRKQNHVPLLQAA
ncbi:MAG TPA: AraC family transcriptional regulator [Terriglobales bacterium]|jgi:AraC-like DNA-binding protein|nr:AraC family transcriptional regulator [Terriglobales bacterium]